MMPTYVQDVVPAMVMVLMKMLCTAMSRNITDADEDDGLTLLDHVSAISLDTEASTLYTSVGLKNVEELRFVACS